MIEKYIYIDRQTARKLLSDIKDMKAAARGFDKHAYLIGDYAVLTVSKLKLRNVTTRDDNLVYYDELIKTLWDLYNNGISIVPVLGYCYDPESKDGIGYIIQQRAKGTELFDDSVMKAFYVWVRKKPEDVYFYPNDINAEEYIMSRTKTISEVPQKHYDKFVKDIMVLNENDILIDFIGKSNFFYDSNCGFQFIDLDSHTDHKYGLCECKDNDNLGALLGCFTPCHLAVGTRAFGMLGLDDDAMSGFGDDKLLDLKQDNMIIFEKCKRAVRNNGFSEEEMDKALIYLKIYGGQYNE